MNASELAKRASELPDRFADRLTPDDLQTVRRIASAGEWPLEIEALLGCLQERGAVITTAEHDELQALLDAMKKADGSVDFAGDQNPQHRLDALTVESGEKDPRSSPRILPERGKPSP